MNNKLLIAVSALVISAAFATSANAGCDGFYLGGRGGIVNHNIGDSDSKLGDEKLEIDDNAMMWSGALGYRLGYFRFEAEYVWRETTEDSKSTNFGTTSETEFESTSYMANVYWDLSPYTWFTPYFSAGLGMTDLTYTFKNPGTSDEVDESNFTWALGGGISAQVTNRFNVDLGYRYYDMGDVGEASINAHEVYGGLRYVF